MNKVQAGIEMAKQKHCIFRCISTFSTSPKLAQKSLNCLAQVSPHWGGTGPAGEEQQGKVHIGLQNPGKLDHVSPFHYGPPGPRHRAVAGQSGCSVTL